MNNSAISVATSLSPQQQIVRRRLNDELAKILNRRPAAAQDHYAHLVINNGDWFIVEQPVMQLPLLLCQLITLQQREVGNALIEETRAINNQYVGRSFRMVEVMLQGDPTCLDLRARLLTWAEEVARQVNFKLRHQAKDEPYRTFFKVYDSIVTPIDQNIAHGNGLYTIVWGPVVDLLPYQFLEAMILIPDHFTFSHDLTSTHQVQTRFKRSPTQLEQKRLTSVLSLYAVEPAAYVDNVILGPLLTTLRSDPALPTLEQRSQQYYQMFADLVEAYPYLLSSDRAERYIFTLPGTTCVAAFSFLSASGCGRVMFSDDVESLRSGLHTNYMRGALNCGYDGRLSLWMHPWRTINRVFGEEGAITLSWWILGQIHGQMVKDFLKIQHYYLHASDSESEDLKDDAVMDETLLYVAMAKASDPGQNADDTQFDFPATAAVDIERFANKLPQLRRRYFFKLLEHCGVEIVQGKGSEFKLLRKAKRPFRLGNHYGTNPTIPAFLAASILKRLEISSEEWVNAIAIH